MGAVMPADVESWRTLDPAEAGRRYEAELARTGQRKERGAFYTPAPLVEFLLDHTLEPILRRAETPAEVLALRVLDPACGVGLFLIAARRRLIEALGRLGSDEDPAGCLVGVDLDPVAASLAAGFLPGSSVLSADSLLDDVNSLAAYDVVVGNPPFLNRLQRRSAPAPEQAARLSRLSEGQIGPYTDLSAVFLQRSMTWVRPGGRVGLVQPLSVLASRDARPVREFCVRAGALRAVWASTKAVFAAGVRTCAVVLESGGVQGSVDLWGEDFAPSPTWEEPIGEEWGPLLARIAAVPSVSLRGARLGDIAACTADFRDQFYGLVPYVDEAGRDPGRVPLITSGLIDPAHCHFGNRPTRFAKQRFEAPGVDVDALPDVLAQWARRRLVPKVLVATQGRVLEAVADEQGAWLPSVPVITVAPVDPQDVWRVLAVLLAPPISAYAATAYAGAGLSPTAVKLSARQVAELPLPTDEEAWSVAARLIERAQRESSRELLLEAGATMCAAYRVPHEPILPWWSNRLPVTRPEPPGPGAV